MNFFSTKSIVSYNLKNRTFLNCRYTRVFVCMIDLVILLELLININRSVIILCADYDFLVLID